MSIAIQAASLFYQGIDSKKGSVILNKKQIESAYMEGNLNVVFTMITGEKFTLAMNATMFGELCYQLKEIGHKNFQEVKP